MITPYFLKSQLQPMSDLSKAVLEDEYWRAIIGSSQSSLKNFDAGITDEFDFFEFRDIKLHRLVRFCLPLFEIGRVIDSHDADPDRLAAMFLWSEVWRPLDNLLDGDGDKFENLICYSQAFQRACQYQLHISKNYDYDICQKLNENVEIEKKCNQRIKFGSIYKRAAVLETPLLYGNEYSKNTINQFRRYINLIGLSHDVVDMIRDLKSGQITLPTHEFSRLDPTLSFLSGNITKVISVCQEKFIDQQNLLMSEISLDCFITNGNLSIEYNYAF